ncbi:MAG TPA: carboxypeptidase regulatory-like domain-containing protein [Gemmatimonadaceae bacterium]|nr:carboxypeptidase regulatory-like domain-containing protein [Gemmatimonadaceae bacterium]
MFRCIHISILIVIATAACSRDDTVSAGTRDSETSPDRVAPRPAVITAPAQPYRVVPVAAGGSIAGTLDVDGLIPSDTIIRPSLDQNVCGTQILERRVARSGTRIGGALVWLTDIRSGKALPLERRFEITNDDCILDPNILVIYTTSTLNVGTEDRALHTNRFINVGSGLVQAIAPFNDAGEVVPLDHVFKEPSQIEVVCEQHPWTRAWVAVLDHPYSAKTSANGTFNIPDIPPGRYRVRAWHPHLGFTDDSVTVVAGQQANVGFRIRRPGAPPLTPTVPAPVPAAVDTPAGSTARPPAPDSAGAADSLRTTD